MKKKMPLKAVFVLPLLLTTVVTTQIIYSLGGQGNITVAGNTTLTDLHERTHSLTVYVLDLAGNAGTSEIIYFGVDVPELSLTASVAASGALIAIISMSLLVNFRKRNGENN